MLGVFQWDFWWIFPIVGMLIGLGVCFVAFRFMSAGRGCPCMGGRGVMSKEESKS